MVNKKREGKKVNFWLKDDEYKKLASLASEKNRTMSEMVRELIFKQLAIDGAVDGSDIIRNQIHAELENVMKPKVERIIKLLMRTGIMSTSFCFFTLKLVDAIIPPDADGKRSYEEILNEAKKDAAAYLYISDAHLETVYREFEKNNQ